MPDTHAASARLVTIAAGVALAVRLPFLRADPNRQLAWMSDDACYYLEAARRSVEAGAWPSMDGVHATNGFHPLYFLLVYAVQTVAGTDPERVVPVVFALNLLLNALAIVVLAYGLRSRLAGGGGWLAVAALAMSPAWLAHGLANVENGLSSLLILCAVLRWCARFDVARAATAGAASAPAGGHARRVKGGWWLDGALLGLAMAARTDSVVFAAAYVAGCGIVRLRREPVTRVARDLAVCVAIAAVIVAPWLVANALTFGTAVQDSAVALATRFARLHGEFPSRDWWAWTATNAGFWLYRLAWSWGLVPLTAFLCAWVLPLPRRAPRVGMRAAGTVLVLLCAAALAIRANDPRDIVSARWAAIELALAAVAFVVGLVAVRLSASPSRGRTFSPAPATLRFLATWVALLVAVYAAGLGAFQLWYTTAPVLAALFVVTLPALAALLHRRSLLATLVIALVTVQSVTRIAAELAPDPASSDFLVTGAALRQRLERASAAGTLRIGAFDSGQLGYRVHPFPIANLDGVMNHDTARALGADDLAGFLRTAGFTHVITDAARLNEFQRVSAFDARIDAELSADLGIEIFRIEHAAPQPQELDLRK